MNTGLTGLLSDVFRYNRYIEAGVQQEAVQAERQASTAAVNQETKVYYLQQPDTPQ